MRAQGRQKTQVPVETLAGINGGFKIGPKRFGNRLVQDCIQDTPVIIEGLINDAGAIADGRLVDNSAGKRRVETFIHNIDHF